MKYEEYISCNNDILNFLSEYLSNNSKYITKEMMDEVRVNGLNEEFIYSMILATLFDDEISEKADVFKEYFLRMIKKEEPQDYYNNPYYLFLSKKLKNIKHKNWQYKWDKYEPFELFVSNDMVKYLNGQILPSLGYFSESFSFPAVYENDHIWMSLTPNEINTMRQDIEDAKGTVLVGGLGLGYYVYMISLKKEVNKIVVLERDKDVIDLFNKYFKDGFEFKEKIEIINTDALEYLNSNDLNKYNYIYMDLWHDVSDGKELYKRIKEIDIRYPNITFRYWIEKTILCYL